MKNESASQTLKILAVTPKTQEIHVIQEMIVRYPQYKLTGVFRNGKAAIGAVREAPPDILIIDISLDDMNGLDFIQQLEDLIPSVKFILLNDSNPPEVIMATYRLGIHELLTKPLDIGELHEVINKPRTLRRANHGTSE